MTGFTRRQFHQSVLSAAAAAALPSVAGAQTAPVLHARTGSARLAPAQYPETRIWGYDGTVPGPILRAQQGQRIGRVFQNDLPQASSVHWHGIRIENAMDGVPGMTQAAVEPGAAFLYDFVLPDAGTYWYHPHNRTYEQMARGLYGALIVDEATGAPEVDLDEVLLLDDWRLNDDAQIAEGFGNMRDWSHAGRIGNWITVNGDGGWSRAVPRLARMRLRLVNTANARIFTLAARGLEGWVVALDGMPLAAPQPLAELTLAPAQRADLIVDVVAGEGEEAFLVSYERDGGYAVAAFPVTRSAREMRMTAPVALPPNPVPALGPLESARRADLLMEGGAMGAMAGAMMGGQRMEMREMVAAGKVWAFNGMADMADTPLIEANRGETVRIAMTNDTRWQHGMHLHGHHFRQIGRDGALGPLRDTLLMNRGETAEIAFVADNPGDWLLHCHMLEHSAGGMMTWLRVL
ncbi:multicopper oxidase family protein [Roseobacter denitrificans]|uniref:Multicopper oxidase, putative n=1 Tax=Roseobacter denitrificans (strain ATCC 33942 / OCh 114) TaxID=375451 RepID=Q167F7_ROSDO|nr:multicopper oxidase family protein [Roseobacter denitrificans]ABG31886.1 multicopper oxidase, putative [Roseobacter denitrificans OCh 114]AVL51438.1 multicopper oxidase family protein [Roseobacter denitrificans]SFG42428.1 Multicopper oxidase with three cupredoxin domains (includes cell division protein FtsP and spore coat protein CotA) [Roseobacter denitrificans OCh 114]